MTGISHFGASSNGWYHASTNPLRSTTGYVRTRALRFVRWLYGNVRARAVAVELPAVERAREQVAVDGAAVREVRAEVRAERVLEMERAAESRQSTSSRFQYSTAVTSPGARSLGNATWYQPNGIGNGKRREAMPAILEHVPILPPLVTARAGG